METIRCEPRPEKGRHVARTGRKAGRVPANLYGKKGEGVTLWLPATDALHLHQEGLTEVTLEVGGKAEPARVQEIQVDPLHDVVLHVDFVRV